jgi:hypothetical protein
MKPNKTTKTSKKVIYTSLAGNYDALKEPSYVIDGWDYICFSNDMKVNRNSIWQVRPIPYKNKDNLRLSRYVKLNPHLVLKDYDISLWVDANLEIANLELLELLNKLIGFKNKIFIPKHPDRNCIYDELQVCIKEGKDKRDILLEQKEFLTKEGFPKKIGLFENNIILRRHNDSSLINLNNEWWQLYEKYSKRDQLSLRYLLWKHEIECLYFFMNSDSARNNNFFNYYDHNESTKQKIKRKLTIRFNKLFKK